MVDLKLTKTTKIMMMGTPEEQQLVEPEEKFDVSMHTCSSTRWEDDRVLIASSDIR